MIPRARFVLVAYLVCLSLVSSSPALAQYMYLDSNGDGIHTSADAVNPGGPTTIDIWLDTAHNRDGSPVICTVEPSIVVDLFIYFVNLQALGGTISWGTYVNQLPNVSIRFAHGATPTEFADGYGLGPGTSVPPGRYHLGTLPMSVTGGSPAVAIAPSSSLVSDPTSFGSHCYGIDFDNTLKLGQDWNDVDGLPFGTDGSANHLPVLGPLGNMALATGDYAFQSIIATDQDNQPLTFSKASGPAFMTVSNAPTGTGTGSGTISFAPTATDAGTAVGTVSVSDGFGATQGSLEINVTAGPNHAPSLSAPDVVTVVAGTTPRFALYVADPDAQPISFGKVEGGPGVPLAAST